MEKLFEIYKQLPNITKADLHNFGKTEDLHLFEINCTRIVSELTQFLRLLIGEFIKWEILHPTKGFVMNDETYCLFKNVARTLKQITEDANCDEYDYLLTRFAIGICLLILGKLE